jgi:hypothetical protein
MVFQNSGVPFFKLLSWNIKAIHNLDFRFRILDLKQLRQLNIKSEPVSIRNPNSKIQNQESFIARMLSDKSHRLCHPIPARIHLPSNPGRCNW